MVMIPATSTNGSGPESKARYPTMQQPKMQIVAIDRGSERTSIGIPLVIVALLSCVEGQPLLLAGEMSGT